MKQYQLSIIFDIPIVFISLNPKDFLIEHISILCQFIEGLSVLGVGNYIRKIDNFEAIQTVSIFYHKMEEIINSQFKNIIDVIDHKEKLVLASHKVIEVILNNRLFVIDTEDSIFTLILMWIKVNRIDREKYLLKWLPLINCPKITLYYLINIVSCAINEITQEKIRDELMRMYLKTLEIKILDTMHPQNQIKNGVERSFNDSFDDKKTGMKVIYNKISELEFGIKYYCRPMFFNGYSFYLFITIQEELVDQIYNINGYLRCVCEATDSVNHYLPLKLTFSVLNMNGKPKDYIPISVTFDNYNKSIGMRLIQHIGSWEQIKKKQSNLICNDRLEIIVRIECE
jgi:hypothetical protein